MSARAGSAGLPLPRPSRIAVAILALAYLGLLGWAWRAMPADGAAVASRTIEEIRTRRAAPVDPFPDVVTFEPGVLEMPHDPFAAPGS